MDASHTIQTPSDAVKAYLASVPGISFRSPGDLVQFDANMSVDKALKTMNDSKITGAPVYVGSPLYDELTDVDAGGFSAAVAVSSKDYVGIVDVCDLATLILTKGLKRKTPQGVFAKLGDLFVSDSEHNVQSAVNLSTTHRFYALPTTGNLAQAAAVMARKRVHRVAISNPDKENRIEGMITGSSIVRALRDNLQVLGSLGHMPIGNLVPTGRDLVLTACAATATARECVQSLLLHSVLAMPLVDSDGAIVANFSVSDIRLLAGKSAEQAETALGGSALELVKGEDGRVRPPVAVMPSDSLGSVIELLTSSGVHRVYIVDSARRPIGSVTVTDIIRMVLSPTLTAYGAVETSPASEESKSADEPLLHRTVLAAKRVSHELIALLASTTAAEFIVRDGVRIDKLVDVPAEASAMTVLRELSNNNLSAVPVYREDTEAVPDLVSFIPYAYPAEKRYVGWVDAGDLCGLLLDKGLRKRSEGVLGLLKSLTRDSDRTSVAAVNYSNNDPFWAIPSERNLEQVIRVLGNCKVHRLAVVDVEEANHIVGIITQSAIIKYISENRAILGDLSTLTMSTFVSSSRPVIKLPMTATVAEALKLMLSCKITGVPVIDGSDRIIANVSVTDVRYLAKVKDDEVDRVLALPIMDFLIEVKTKLAGSTLAPPSLTPIVLHTGDSFAAAIDLLAASGLHRLYIVDEANSPVGVFTLTDAIKALSNCM